jgi:hypothetical protein
MTMVELGSKPREPYDDVIDFATFDVAKLTPPCTRRVRDWRRSDAVPKAYQNRTGNA